MLPLSLTGRLAVFFALVVSIALASMGAFAYYSLAAQLESRDDEVVRGKLDQVQHFLREVDGRQGVSSAQHRFGDLVRGYSDLIVRVTSQQDGVVLFSTGDSDATLTTENVSGMVIMRSENATLGKDAAAVVVVVAKTGEDRQQVTARFRATLLFGTTVGVVLTAMVGAAITRRELQPAHALIRQINRISVERLSYRVDMPVKPTEVRDIAGAFNAMLKRVEDGYIKLSRFSADLAHDLRTPLNNLIGHAEVTLSRDRRSSEYVTVIEDSLIEYQRLARMIDAMLFLARADSAKVALEISRIQLNPELRKLSTYFLVLAEERGVSILIDGDAIVDVDAILFQRAINNLLSNAVRHAKSGTAIAINISSDESICRIDICNWGDRISEHDLPLIFDRFYRGDRARSNSLHSTGLGLAIVKSIMELHGGRVTVESPADGMTRFTLQFPLKRREEEERRVTA
ncbi:heavy metal sensor histidine kinase [Cupriavidus plantarum]